jgi:hypothetical protein
VLSLKSDRPTSVIPPSVDLINLRQTHVSYAPPHGRGHFVIYAYDAVILGPLQKVVGHKRVSKRAKQLLHSTSTGPHKY